MLGLVSFSIAPLSTRGVAWEIMLEVEAMGRLDDIRAAAGPAASRKAETVARRCRIAEVNNITLKEDFILDSCYGRLWRRVE